MNNDSFLIEEFDLDIAKDVCKLIKDPSLRNKATANVAAANFAKKYFQDCEIDTESGLHNIAQVLEDIDISDIYIKDNYIDVRLYFNDNELFVPKAHFDNNLLPVAYMFIKIGEDLSNGLVTGFITPAAIDTTNAIDGYYHVNEEDLISFYDVESNLINKFDEDLPDNLESQIFDYLDNKLSDKQAFYQILLDSKEARIKLQNAAKAKTIFDFISIPSADKTVDEEPAELLEEAPESLETLEEFDSDFSLAEEPALEEFNEIEEVGTLDLEEADTLSFEESESMELDAHEEEFEPIEPIDSLSISVEEEVVTEAEEDEFSISEETPVELDSFDADSIQMLGAGDYEEQPLQDFTANEIEKPSIQEETEEVSIGMLDSSSLTFDNETPELEVSEPEVTEEPPAVELTISDETEVEPEAENNNFDFSTNVTPSLDTFEEIEEEPHVDFEEELLNEEDNVETQELPDNGEEEVSENSEQIDTLFNPEEEPQEVVSVVKPKSKNILLPVIAVVAVLAAVGYYSYTKFAVQQPVANDIVDNTQNEVQPAETAELPQSDEIAMPVESVENVKVQLNTNEGNSVSIPAIEQNLDASITVSNLRVEFEIPAGYKASKTAERYFTKMGKILQVNLKTELLLLTKQPITNKIAVELEYNKATQKFDVKGLVASSGEQTIDDLILRTVKNALNINLNMNMSIFGNVAGNPVLVIKL